MSRARSPDWATRKFLASDRSGGDQKKGLLPCASLCLPRFSKSGFRSSSSLFSCFLCQTVSFAQEWQFAQWWVICEAKGFFVRTRNIVRFVLGEYTLVWKRKLQCVLVPNIDCQYLLHHNPVALCALVYPFLSSLTGISFRAVVSSCFVLSMSGFQKRTLSSNFCVH